MMYGGKEIVYNVTVMLRRMQSHKSLCYPFWKTSSDDYWKKKKLENNVTTFDCSRKNLPNLKKPRDRLLEYIFRENYA